MKRNERGLALLLVVALMALVTLIAVSLAVITRVETSVGAVRSAQAEARQNALQGLHTALGRLQEAAGPDQRVTATAEATGTVNHPHWVGVWRSDTAGTAPETWLVSGETPSPQGDATIGRRQIRIVRGDGTVETRVSVPLELLRERADAEDVRGGFAYFVADQGLKAQLAAAEAAPEDNDVFAQRRALMGGSRPLGFGGTSQIDTGSSTWQNGLEHSLDTAQWLLLADEGTAATVRGAWHDYAGWSRGLLVDTAGGGLKTDLSLAGDAAIPGLGSFAALATPAREAELSPTYPMRAASGGSGEFYDGIHPLITQFGLQFSVHTISSSSRTLETRLRCFVELANPFAAALEPEDLRLVVSGLPGALAIDARTLGDARDHGIAAVDLAALYVHHSDPQGRPAVEFDLPFTASRWEPGRVVSWRLQSGNTMGEGANREMVFDASTRTSYWRERPGTALDGPDALTNSSELRFTGTGDWQIHLSLQRSNGEELLSATLPEFYQVDTAWLDANSTAPDFGMEVRLVGRVDFQDAEGRSSWIRDAGVGDLRRDTFAEVFWAPKVDLETASYNVAFSGPNSGVEARQLYNRDPVDRSYLSYYQPGYNADVALFELPRQPWLSVGALQHLPFANGPIYNVGNSWSERNAWFDRFFFSGRQSGGLPDAVRLSPALERLQADEPLVDERSAQQWWVRGAFNINSVRPAAWAALLRGVGLSLEGVPLAHTTHASASGEVTGDAVERVSRPIGRFSQAAGETWEITPNSDSFQAILRTYRRGVRSLEDAQVQALAEEVAALVAQRIAARGPYRSLEEFLASEPAFGGLNAWEQAIALHDQNATADQRINWDQYFPSAPEPIDVAAPSYLTSGDLMTALGPQLSARSDTFLIRAYGESVLPVAAEAYETSEIEGRAWVEALVQRFPEGVDAAEFAGGAAGDWREPVADPNWGRRFRIITLRWLHEDDL